MTRTGLDRLAEKRKEALFSGDAIVYTKLCGDLGIPPEDIEDPHLIERALADEIYERRRIKDFESKTLPVESFAKKRKRRRPKPVDYENDSSDLEHIAGIALRPFSPLGTGERVWANEYRQRLSELMHAGYHVIVGFSKMGRSGLMAEHSRIKDEMVVLLERHPEIKERIDERNQRLQSPYSY